MATLTKGTTFTSGDVVTPAKLNNLVDQATLSPIVTADIADAQITTAKIADANVTTAKIADANVTTAKIADANVTDAKLATGAVTGAAGGGKIAASAITAQTVIADPLADTDEFLVHDASASALRRVAWSTMQPVGSVLQTVNASTNSQSSITTVIPRDNTVPQNTEGTEIMSASITPSSTANKILVRVQIQGTSNVNNIFVVALFKNTTANALTAAHNMGNGFSYGASFEYLDAPATTSSTVYKVRVGPSSGTLLLNSSFYGNLFGAGTVVSNITLQEIKG